VQALLSNTGARHDVIETKLTTIAPRRRRRDRRKGSVGDEPPLPEDVVTDGADGDA